MAIKLYKMSFNHAHFGEGHLNESHAAFDAGRLFSALFIEALKLGKEAAFLDEANKDSFQLSDAFPYIDDVPYLPKPIGYPKHRDSDEANLKSMRREAKKVKKIKYIPWDQMDLFLTHQANIDDISEAHGRLEEHESITKKGEDPYEVGVTAYKNALYILATESPLFDSLMSSLQFSGLGGKRSSGYGRFTLEKLNVPNGLSERLNSGQSNTLLLLSTSLPKDEELESSLEAAYYMIKKTSGFTYSESVGEQLRKQDLYKLKSGSTFEQAFTGDIRDVSPDDFPHPVWNYAKGFFYALNI